MEGDFELARDAHDGAVVVVTTAVVGCAKQRHEPLPGKKLVTSLNALVRSNDEIEVVGFEEINNAVGAKLNHVVTSLVAVDP